MGISLIYIHTWREDAKRTEPVSLPQSSCTPLYPGPPVPQVQTGSSRADCSWQCPIRFWIYLRMDTPKALWTTFFTDEPLTIKKSFLMVKLIFPCFNLSPLPLVLSLGTTEKNLAPSSQHPPLRYLYTLMRSPLGLLFSRLNRPSSLSLSSYDTCSIHPSVVRSHNQNPKQQSGSGKFCHPL